MLSKRGMKGSKRGTEGSKRGAEGSKRAVKKEEDHAQCDVKKKTYLTQKTGKNS